MTLRDALQQVKEDQILRLVLVPTIGEWEANKIAETHGFDFVLERSELNKLANIDPHGGNITVDLCCRRLITSLSWYMNIFGQFVASAEILSNDGQAVPDARIGKFVSVVFDSEDASDPRKVASDLQSEIGIPVGYVIGAVMGIEFLWRKNLDPNAVLAAIERLKAEHSGAEIDFTLQSALCTI